MGLGGEKQDVNCIGGLCTLCDADLCYGHDYTREDI